MRNVPFLLSLICMLATVPAEAQITATETKLVPELRSEAASEDHFGSTVALSGDRAAVGAPDADIVAYRGGGVDIYIRQAGGWTRETRIDTPDEQLQNFGLRVALDGDVLAVAAIRPKSNPDDETRVILIYERASSGWIETFRLDTFAGQTQAPTSVSLAAHGDHVAVGYPDESGLPGDSNGAVYVLERAAGNWTLAARLAAPDNVPDSEFGAALALDGDSLIVGAPRAPNPLDNDGGAAYIYHRDGAWESSARLVPVQRQRCGQFGKSVDINGQRAVVAQGCASDFAEDHGSVTTFEHGPLGWIPTDWLLPEPSEGVNGFGVSLALSHDSLAVGAATGFMPNPTLSTLFVYQRGERSWDIATRLDSTAPGDGLGLAVALEDETLLVGSPTENGLSGYKQGAVHILTRGADVWSPDSVLRRPNGDVSNEDGFGWAVAVQDDYLFISAPRDCDSAGPGQGAVYVYQLVNGVWVQRRKLLAPDAQPNDGFGEALAVSGSRLVVGAANAATPAGLWTGAVYVFTRHGADFVLEARVFPQGGTPYPRFGWSVAIDWERIVVGAHEDERVSEDTDPHGAAYVYRLTPAGWQQQARLTASDPVPHAWFGWSVAISGSRVVVGAPYAHEPPGDVHGAAYVFSEIGGAWNQESRLVATDLPAYYGPAYIEFGFAVAMSGGTIAVGAPSAASHGAPDEGRVAVYTRDTGMWQRQAVLRSSHPTIFANFGERLSFQENRLAVGAGGERDDIDEPYGAAYVFARRGPNWNEAIRITASDTHTRQQFGRDALCLDGGRLVVGVPFDGNGTLSHFGAAYDYEVLCRGDVDGDWIIGTEDLAIVLSGFGTPAGATPDGGDLDRDGDIDLADLALVLGNFGNQCP